MEVNTRAEQLRQQINDLDHDYYVLNNSGVTDAEYDRLYFELAELEKKYPHLADPNSPTQRIGGISKGGFPKVKHSTRMLSLENIRTPAAVIHYLGMEDVVLEPKIDGASLELIYRQGGLQQAITRGNGVEGDDVTANARAIMAIPIQLTEDIDITVRGEVFMTYTAFNTLNERLESEGEELMANPRNAAAGTLKLKDPKEVSARNLSFVAYDAVNEFPKLSQYQLTEYLAILGFMNVSLLPVTASCQSVADRFKIESEEMLARRIADADACRKFLDLPTDGLVFKLNDRKKQRELGEGTKYPKWGCAYKFPAEQVETTLVGVTVQVGRTGKMTPVAELKPVLLSGTTVRRASLCNQDEITRLNVDIGDTVVLEKSAEIIPKVVRVAKKIGTGVYQLPATCPCCQTKLHRPKGYVDSFCPNRECEDQVFGALKHATGKSALDIDGCGETLVRELMKHGVRCLSDIFTVDPSFMKAAARKRFEAGRAASAAQPLWRKLHALGIEGFGSTLCQDVSQRWRSLADAFDEAEKFSSLVGKVVFNNIVDYCTSHEAELDRLDSLIGLAGAEQAVGPLTGKTFCITGDLIAGTRSEVSNLIEDAGGTVKSNVSRHLSYLIQGTETGKTKRAAAEKNKVPIISEQELFQMMGKEMPVPKDMDEKEY